ncbi:MAG TPA: glycosyltransferase family 39 protein [Terriglobales bacterium]
MLAVCAAVVLRIFFILKFPHVSDDSFVYGDIAKNWLQHGMYGLTGDHGIYPTYIRLPGYPAFLAAVFAVFGVEHYRAVLFIQMFVDIGTCFLIADLARRVCSARAAKLAFLFAAICPFLANYTAAALSETLEIFFTVLALDLAISAMGASHSNGGWIGCGLAVGAAILVRPDGGILFIAIGLYLFVAIFKSLRSPKQSTFSTPAAVLRAGLIIAIISLAPLIPWTLRNWTTFYTFQPLAPRYANEQDEFAPLGFNRWVKTWMVEYASVEEVYWNVPGAKIDLNQLPGRAFDSPSQRLQTEQVVDAYNAALDIDPRLDQQFAALAAARIHQNPLRYYITLPLARIADMWLRPRTELLPPDPRWWEFNDDKRWLAVALAFGVLNLAYVGAAFFGAMSARKLAYISLLLEFVVLRSLFLGTIESPEPRYTMECYPIVIVLAAILFAMRNKTPDSIAK